MLSHATIENRIPNSRNLMVKYSPRHGHSLPSNTTTVFSHSMVLLTNKHTLSSFTSYYLHNDDENWGKQRRERGGEEGEREGGEEGGRKRRREIGDRLHEATRAGGLGLGFFNN